MCALSQQAVLQINPDMEPEPGFENLISMEKFHILSLQPPCESLEATEPLLDYADSHELLYFSPLLR